MLRFFGRFRLTNSRRENILGQSQIRRGSKLSRSSVLPFPKATRPGYTHPPQLRFANATWWTLDY